MAPNLIALPASGFTASYKARTSTLKLRARGTIAGFWLSPFLRRETWMGGLKFSLLGYPGGGGGPKDPQPLDVSIEEQISLPLPGFNNKTVLVDTANGTWSVPISYEEPLPQDSSDQPSSNKPPQPAPVNDRGVLPPIKEYLPMGGVLPITAAIPEGRRSGVVVRFNEQYFQLIGAGVSDGQITWSFKWARVPEGKPDASGSPPSQLIEVHTDQWNGLPPPESRTTHIVQGYPVYFVLMK